MNELTPAQQAQSEIALILQKYNCELVYREVKQNGVVEMSGILVIQKKSIIKPLNGEKVLKFQ